MVHIIKLMIDLYFLDASEFYIEGGRQDWTHDHHTVKVSTSVFPFPLPAMESD